MIKRITTEHFIRTCTYLMLMKASSPPCLSNASSVSLIKSPMFSRRCCPYSIPSPKLAIKQNEEEKLKKAEQNKNRIKRNAYSH